MPTVTITAKYVNPPADGKKFGSIVDSNDNRYPAAAMHTSKVQKGATVTLEYKEEQWGGKPVMVVTGVHDQPKPQTNGHHAPTSGHGDAKERGMFIMGVVGRAMGSGQFTVNDVRLLTLAAAEAWDALHAPRPAPQQPQEQRAGYVNRRSSAPPDEDGYGNSFHSDPLPI